MALTDKDVVIVFAKFVDVVGNGSRNTIRFPVKDEIDMDFVQTSCPLLYYAICRSGYKKQHNSKTLDLLAITKTMGDMTLSDAKLCLLFLYEFIYKRKTFSKLNQLCQLDYNRARNVMEILSYLSYDCHEKVMNVIRDIWIDSLGEMRKKRVCNLTLTTSFLLVTNWEEKETETCRVLREKAHCSLRKCTSIFKIKSTEDFDDIKTTATKKKIVKLQQEEQRHLRNVQMYRAMAIQRVASDMREDALASYRPKVRNTVLMKQAIYYM